MFVPARPGVFQSIELSPNEGHKLTIDIVPLTATDRAAWETLAIGYKTFYQTPLPPEEYETAWQRLLRNDRVHALGAKRDGELVGIAHFLFHTSAWAPKVCYLQDLFVVPEARGHGVAHALIDAVAVEARNRDASRFYWQTKESNETARKLYDRVATFNGFIRYDYPLDPPVT